MVCIEQGTTAAAYSSTTSTTITLLFVEVFSQAAANLLQIEHAREGGPSHNQNPQFRIAPSLIYHLTAAEEADLPRSNALPRAKRPPG